MDSLNLVEISRSALIHNLAICRSHMGTTALMALVKADGYGHGMIDCARILANEKVEAFGVAEACEGQKLREAGISSPIFVLVGSVSPALSCILDHQLTPVLTDRAAVPELAALAQRKGQRIEVHIKMDAGMGRQGIFPSELPALVQEIEASLWLQVAGIMAHFPMGDVQGADSSTQVRATFGDTTEQIRRLIPRKCCLHLANSGGLFYVSDTCFDMVRLGISLYGYYPDGHIGRDTASPPLLRPVMRFSTRIIQVRHIPAGTGLGYNHIFTTKRPTTIAVLPVGYANGYLRNLSNKACVLIHGQRMPVVGRVSMNLTLVDATDLGSVQPGDEAVLLGNQGEASIYADEIAAWMDTISYEPLCLFGNLNRRVIVD